MNIKKLMLDFRRFVDPTTANRDRKEFKRKISRFFGIKEKDENGNLYLVRKFKKHQHIGAVIRASKTKAYQVVSNADENGFQEIIELKRR